MPSPNSSRAVLSEDWRAGGFGLYIHWPFCQSKCPYCDFNSHVVATIDQERWKHAYIAELNRVGAETKDRVLNTIFFGGGTPSLMRPDIVSAVLETIQQTWTVANDLEITLEANPGSVEAERFQGYRDAGVNRISMGIQALNDADLRALGRLHTVAEARAAFDIARTTFDRVSFDLIYARQGQSPEDWERELTEALNMAADHLSLYQLTIEDGTAFGDRLARGRLPGLPDEDASADLFFLTQQLCDTAGLSAYEVSNHARKGSESRHNLIYWQAGDYIGIGPGAHGRLTLAGSRFATETRLEPLPWLMGVEKQGTGELTRALLSARDQAVEYLLMGLRLRNGIDLARLDRMSRDVINLKKVAGLEDLGLLERSNGSLKATSVGRPVLNAVLREILLD